MSTELDRSNAQAVAAACDPDAAVAFLQALAPEGPWVLWVREPDGNLLACSRAFYPGDEAEVGSWIISNCTMNQYFHVNPYPSVRKERGKEIKAKKSDIAAVNYLHVDVDPSPISAGASDQEKLDSLKRERQAILANLELAGPTFIIDSGGGYQALWRLTAPIPLDGTEEAADEASAYNHWLANKYYGDAPARDVSRVLRLPGTINWPDKRKREKGRRPAKTYLVGSSDKTFPLTDFGKFASKTGDTVQVSPIAPGFVSVDEAWSAIDDNLKAIIRAGSDPTDPSRWPSRSEAVFYVACELVRAGLNDETIAHIISNPDYAISAHVRDQKNAVRYAFRQAQKARKEVESAPLVISKDDPLHSAREYIARMRPTLMHYNGDWLAYDGSAYIEIENDTIHSELYQMLEHAIEISTDAKGNKTKKPFRPNKTKIDHVRDALKGLAHRPRDTFEPPCWLEGEGPPPHEIIAGANGLFHLPTGELLPPTPRYFTRNALEFDIDPNAPTPVRFIEFLHELWPDDPETIGTVQEIFGYLLAPDTSQQKIFLVVGPPRSGKGTLAKVVTALVGGGNVCAPSINSLGTNFGLQPLIGKQVAQINDMRLDGKTDKAGLAGNLLGISGEDQMTIDRKYKDAWTGRLSVRFLIMTNIIPGFADASGALAHRFIPVVMTRTFLGKEKPNLANELLKELPGILNWAIEGWRRLHQRGHFVLPAASQEALTDIADMAAPVAAFVRDDCELDSQAVTSKSELFDGWKRHCGQTGRSHPGTESTFGRDLKAAFPSIATTKVKLNGTRTPAYRGIRLRDRPFQADQGDMLPEEERSPF